MIPLRHGALLALALALASIARPAAYPIPHVTQCRICTKCHLGDQPPPGYEAANAADLARLAAAAGTAADSAGSSNGNSSSSSGVDGGGLGAARRARRLAQAASAVEAVEGVEAVEAVEAGGITLGATGGRSSGGAPDRRALRAWADVSVAAGGDGSSGGGADAAAGSSADDAATAGGGAADADAGAAAQDDGGEAAAGAAGAASDGAGTTGAVAADGTAPNSGAAGAAVDADADADADADGDGDGDGPEATAAPAKKAKGKKKPRRPRRVAYDPELDPTVPAMLKPSSYRARPDHATRSLPHCEQCYGCATELSHIGDETRLFNTTYVKEKGATSSWIFRSATNMTPSGQAVVKVYCLPLAKRPGAMLPSCRPERISEVMQHLMAIDKLSVDCGFTDIVPRMWLAPVRAIVPDVGYYVDWWALWMEYVEGVSMENLINKGKPRRLSAHSIVAHLNDRLNKTQVVRAAIFDLLTSQCDRHAQNIFMRPDGSLSLIDNEACLQHMWKNCGFDSILVPTTQKQEIVRLANHFVLKLPTHGNAAPLPRGNADPQLLLDYRCYVPGGLLGTAYPPEVASCLRRIAGLTPKQVRSRYGFPDVRVATNLHTRATDMISRGYEWAAKYGQPANAPPKRYRFQPSCCRLKARSMGSYACAHEWQPAWELPIGNPITGRAWDKDRPDTGAYEGGTFPEDNSTAVGVAAGAGAGVGVGAGAAAAAGQAAGAAAAVGGMR